MGRGDHFPGPGRSGLRRGVGEVRLRFAGWQFARRVLEQVAGVGVVMLDVAVGSEDGPGIGDGGCLVVWA